MQQETPTHTGGISDEARQRLVERLQKNKERGVHASTKDRKRDRHRHDDRDRHKRSRDRSSRGISTVLVQSKSFENTNYVIKLISERDHDRKRSHSDRREHDSERKFERSSSSRSRSSSVTPRFKDEPLTPVIKVKDPTYK